MYTSCKPNRKYPKENCSISYKMSYSIKFINVRTKFTYICLVKKIFKSVLLLVTVMCYAVDVIEWDEKEIENNYQNECYVYIVTEQTVFNTAISYSIPSEVKIKHKKIHKNDFFFADCTTLFFTNNSSKNSDKLFLCNRALLI